MERNLASDRFAVIAVVLLGLTILVNEPWLMLVASLAGLILGVRVANRGSLTRSGITAVLGLIVALGFALFELLR